MLMHAAVRVAHARSIDASTRLLSAVLRGDSLGSGPAAEPYLARVTERGPPTPRSDALPKGFFFIDYPFHFSFHAEKTSFEDRLWPVGRRRVRDLRIICTLEDDP